MTDTNQTPETNPAETPTAPLPTAPEAAAFPDAVPVTDTNPPLYAEHPPVTHHGVHVPHQVSEGAIAAMVIGALLFAALAFGVGWTARGAVARFQVQRAGMMGQGYGQGYGTLPPGHPNIGGGREGRGMMRGQGYGQQGQGWGQYGGPGTGNRRSGGWQSVPDQSAPATGTQY